MTESQAKRLTIAPAFGAPHSSKDRAPSSVYSLGPLEAQDQALLAHGARERRKYPGLSVEGLVESSPFLLRGDTNGAGLLRVCEVTPNTPICRISRGPWPPHSQRTEFHNIGLFSGPGLEESFA